MALGAQRGSVLRMVVGSGLRLALLGVGIGLVGAVAVTQALRRTLYQVSATDPLTFATVAALLVAIALLASGPRRGGRRASTRWTRCARSRLTRMVHILAVALSLDAGGASHFAQLALQGVQKEYPNKLEHVMTERRTSAPRTLHPAFYGSLRLALVRPRPLDARPAAPPFPDLPEAAEIRACWRSTYGREPRRPRPTYFARQRRAVVRAALRLGVAAEARRGAARLGRRRRAGGGAEGPPAAGGRSSPRVPRVLPEADVPDPDRRAPEHRVRPAFAHDYAQVGRTARSCKELIEERARTYFAQGRRMRRAKWEPGGADFFSPSLVEADLMARVLAADEFRGWFKATCPR